MNDLYELTNENLQRSFPTALKKDDRVAALAAAIAEELAGRRKEIELARIYTRIDELPEELLDILAYDFKVDWYDYDYSVESKRELIKSSFYVHKHMGTPEAVNKMLGAVFPGSYIEEWFSYGGIPHHFQVILEMRDARERADAGEILKAVSLVKRLSSHLDGLVYQCEIGVVIETHGHGYKYTSAASGRKECGTVPRRSTHAGIGDTELEIESGTSPYGYNAPLAGTVPWRNTKGGTESRDLKIDTSARRWPYHTETTGRAEAGTVPRRNTKGGTMSAELEADTYAEGRRYEARSAGTYPYRSTRSGAGDGAVKVNPNATGWAYHSQVSGRAETGTVPERATAGALGKGAVNVGTDAAGYRYNAPTPGNRECGTDPVRNTEGVERAGAFFADADGEGFHYRVKWCGTSYCKSKPKGGA